MDQRITERRLQTRSHQAEAVNAACAELGSTDRATIVMACGSGKTATALWVAEKILPNGGTILCLFPSLSLIRQTIAVWEANQQWGQSFRYIAVCSDQSVTDDYDRPEDMPFAVSTDPNSVAQFVSGPAALKVIFATYHSSGVIADALSLTAQTIDLAIFDEAHRTAGDDDRAFSIALDDDSLFIRKRLFMTATPRVTTRRSSTQGISSYSMDNENIYGRVAYKLSFKEAAAQGIICYYKVLVSVVTRSELGPDILTSAELTEALHSASLRKAVERVRAKKIITFHPTISAARNFADGLAAANLEDFAVYHVSGQLSGSERAARMAAFAAEERSIVTNARCLTEGVDVPAVDLVGFMGRKNSAIDIAQAVGRALRKPENSDKEFGYILLPLLIEADQGESAEEAVARSNLNGLWDILTNLLDEDEALAEALATATHTYADDGAKPSGFLQPFIEIIGENAEAIQRAIDVATLSELGRTFEYGVGKLLKFINREGHADVPQRHVEGDFLLGSWVGNRRNDHRTGMLSKCDTKTLVEIPEWGWSAADIHWRNGLKALKQYIARTGSISVPKNHLENGIKLNSWIAHRRRAYRAGELLHSQIAEIDQIKQWSWDPYQDHFERGFTTLTSFIERELHSQIPKTHVEGDFNLGGWAASIRHDFKRGALPLDRQNRLEAIEGWIWTTRQPQLDKNLRILAGYVQEFGNANVPQRYLAGDVKLGAWVSNQRERHKKGLLLPERIATLEKFPGWSWAILTPFSDDTDDDKFSEGFKLLAAYAEAKGHTTVPKDLTVNGINLTQWIRSARQHFRENLLSPPRVNSLQQLPGWDFNPHDDSFDRYLTALKEIQTDGASINLPRQTMDSSGSLRLAEWAAYCRVRYRSGKLAAARVRQLEEIPGWTWEPTEDSWENIIASLKKLVAKTGSATADSRGKLDGFSIGRAIQRLRKQHAAGALTKDRIETLERLPGWAWKGPKQFDDWHQTLRLINQFYEREGHARIPVAHIEDTIPLGSRTRAIRNSHEKGTLPMHIVNAVSDLPGWYWGKLKDASTKDGSNELRP